MIPRSCAICDGIKTVEFGYYSYIGEKEMGFIETGTKECPGCDGSGISELAWKEWEELGNKR